MIQIKYKSKSKTKMIADNRLYLLTGSMYNMQQTLIFFNGEIILSTQFSLHMVDHSSKLSCCIAVKQWVHNGTHW